MRTFIQALSLLLFSTLFFLATYKLPDWLPADIYLRLDPLLGMNAIFAAREIISRALWSLIIIGATLVVGRFFCAYVCPMGVSIDFLDLLFFRKKKRQGMKWDIHLRRVKYYLLTIDRSLCCLPHGSHVTSHAVLYFLCLSSGNHLGQSHH
jgi:polyferredoxin